MQNENNFLFTLRQIASSLSNIEYELRQIRRK